MASKLKIIRTAFGIALLTVLIWYLNPSHIALALDGLNYVWVIAAALLIISTTLLGALNLHLFINLAGNFAFKSFLPVFWVSWAIGLIFPGQIGDIASIAAQLQKRGINLATSISRSLLDKLISLILMIFFASFGFAYLLPSTLYATWLLGLLLLIALSASQFKRLFNWLCTRQGKVANFISNIQHETIQLVTLHPQKIAINTALTLIKIILAGLSYWCAFNALGYHGINPAHVIALVAISSLTAYIPISFNGIGTAEIVGVLIFTTLGMSQADILTAYLVLRTMVMLIAWLPAALWLLLTARQPDPAP